MKKNINHIIKSMLALLVSVCICFSLLPVSAMASVCFDAPYSSMPEDTMVLTGATAADNTFVLSMLGVNVTATNDSGVYNAGGMTDSYGTDSCNLGVFGSDINDNPDPYLYNFYYNLYQTQSGGSDYSVSEYKLWEAAPYTLIWNYNTYYASGRAYQTKEISINNVTKTCNPAFFYEPDILLGGITDGYADQLALYQRNYNDSYIPTIFLGYGTGQGHYAPLGTRSDGLGLEYNQFDMSKGVVYLGTVIQTLSGKTGKTTRYEEGAYEIAVDYDKYGRGLYYYTLSQIDNGNLTQVRYASGLSRSSDSYIVYRNSGRMAQYASGIGIDIYDLLEEGYVFSDGSEYGKTTLGYKLTEEQLIEILNEPTSMNSSATGIILGCSPSGIDTDGTLMQEGIRFLNDLPDSTYGLTMQSVENGLGIPLYIGFFYYNQDDTLNPLAYVYYWIEHFYHISNLESENITAQNMLASADLPAGITCNDIDTFDYDPYDVEWQIMDGIEYYLNVLEPAYEDEGINGNSALYWTSLDMEVGIGSDIRDTNISHISYSKQLFTDSFGNTIYKISYDTGKDTDPIIIIPGIMGSRLYKSSTVFNSDMRVWEPSVLTIWSLSENLLSDEIYLRPVINEQLYEEESSDSAEGREYGPTDEYKNLVDTLCEEFPDREIYFFNYDWRKSNEYNAKELHKFINSLGTEVDLVCHSMGGLVASSYYEKYGLNGKVDKIITCGTPYEGAPYLINAVLNQAILKSEEDQGGFDKLKEFGLAFLGGLSEDVKSSFIGVAELLPSEKYISEIPMWEASEDGEDRYELSYDEYVARCESIFGEENISSVVSFQNSLDASSGKYEGYNVLLGYENAYFAVGINQATITAVTFQYGQDEIEERLYEADLDYDIRGDSTVPYLSASIMEKAKKLSDGRYIQFSTNHDGLVGNSSCLSWICDILSSGISDVSGASVNEGSYMVLKIDGEAEVSLTSADETMDSTQCQSSICTSLGRIDRIGENGEIKMVCLYGIDGYDIVLNGVDDGTLDCTVRYYDSDGELYMEQETGEIPIDEGTVIYADTDSGERLLLEIDGNGDGTIDASRVAN